MQDQHTTRRTTVGAGSDEKERRGAAGLKDDVKDTVAREVDDAKSRLSGATEGLRREAEGAGGSISSLVSEQAERRKEDAADGLRAFAGAIRQASDELGERDRSVSARFVQEAAHGLERFSDSLQSRSVSDMTRSVAAFGRENPVTFLSVCLFAGVAAGRFLIASNERAGYGYDDRDDRWREDDGADRAWRGGAAAGGYGASSQGGAGYGGGAAMSAGGYSGGGAGASEGGGLGAGVYAEGGSLTGDQAGAAGAGVLGESGTDARREAGVFGGRVGSQSSEQHAPGDMDDPLATRADTSEPSFPPGGPIGGAGAATDADKQKDKRNGDD